MPTKTLLSLLSPLLLSLACAQTTPPTAAAPAGAQSAAAPAAASVAGGAPRAVITMENGGIIEMDLYPDVAPKTVENFITLSNKEFYNGLKFHRVEPGFVVQGGDPSGNGSGGPGYNIKAEFSSKPHIRGTLAMARAADPDSAGSQFYICLAPAPFLDHNYTVFGQVTKGMEVVDGIRVGDKMKTVQILK